MPIPDELREAIVNGRLVLQERTVEKEYRRNFGQTQPYRWKVGKWKTIKTLSRPYVPKTKHINEFQYVRARQLGNRRKLY